MVQIRGRQDFALDQSFVLSNIVHVDVFGQQLWVTYGKVTILAHVWVQRTHVQVFDFFSFLLVGLVQQTGGIRPSSVQTVPWVQRVRQLVTFHDTLKLGIGFQSLVVFVFPHFYHLVSLLF
jgi:hypothetical protein